MDARPIGIFDSGLGGLTVVKEVKKKLQHESIVYLGDTARVPYGTRSKETVTKFSLQDAYFLAGQGVKSIIIACNTASALAFKEIKNSLAIPVFDVISAGAKGAVEATKNKRVGVIGTRGTIGSHAYKKAIFSLYPKITVYEKACPLFVPLIEEGEIRGNLISLLAKEYLSILRKRKVDTLVLGCTHYPIINGAIADVMGKNVVLVNPAVEIARRLSCFLGAKGLRAANKSRSITKYYVTDLNKRFVKTAVMFLDGKLKNDIKKVQLE